MKSYLIVGFIFLLLVLPGVLWFAHQNNGEAIFILHAGSLVYTYREHVIPAFEEEYDINVLNEGRGSLQSARMIIDGQRTPDVFVSASPDAVNLLIVQNLVTWFIGFATDQLVLAYSKSSPHYDKVKEVLEGNRSWYDLLREKEVKFGRTNPEQDPKGYYAVLMFQLARIFYNQDYFLELLKADQIFPEETLVTRLETAQVDLIVAYKHEAVEKGLPYIELPPEINLGDSHYAEYYAQANYTLKSGEIVKGGPITFVITILSSVKNIKGATSFVEFQLKQGLEILNAGGFGTSSTYLAGDCTEVPASLLDLLEVSV